jgi:hypothetical protein
MLCSGLIGGCSRQPELMPLYVGRETTYVVRSGLDSKVDPVKVVREVPIAGVRGYELKGPLGVSRLAWKDGVLLASSTANARFDPPLPLLALDKKDRRWSGTVEVRGQSSEAEATLQHQEERIEIGGRRMETTLASLRLKMPRGSIELLSWFHPGSGLVQQEQRTNDQLVLRMEILGGPRG